MKRIAVVALALGLSSPAVAAEMAYCQLYADLFAEQFERITEHKLNPWFRDRAYSTCVNSDNEPSLAVLGTAPATGGGGKDAPIAASRLMIAPSQTASATPDREAWRAKCRSRYRSWDEDSQTVVLRRRGARVLCPVKGRPS